MNNRANIVIAGAGGIGRAVALLIREIPGLTVDGLAPNIYIGDKIQTVAVEAAGWVHNGSAKGLIETFEINSNGHDPVLERIVRGADVVLDCTPGEEAPRIAGIARRNGSHYANLTEHVRETEQIMALAAGANTGFILQAGLAPGTVDNFSMDSFKRSKEYGIDEVDSISIKVGALTVNPPPPPHHYGYTWSREGVANEYVWPANVIRNGVKTKVPSLSEISRIVIGGILYEYSTTSGGTADLPDVLEGRVCNLDYETLRYPGHIPWVKGLLHEISQTIPQELTMDEKNIALARQLDAEMQKVIPSGFVEDDMVVIHISLVGRDSRGQPREMKHEYTIFPQTIGGRRLRAIQATTAAGLAESARLLLTGEYKGVVTQSMIDPRKFMSGPYVSQVFR